MALGASNSYLILAFFLLSISFLTTCTCTSTALQSDAENNASGESSSILPKTQVEVEAERAAHYIHLESSTRNSSRSWQWRHRAGQGIPSTIVGDVIHTGRSTESGWYTAPFVFGRETVGGKRGKFYVDTDSSDDDVVNPKKGTLRWGVIQSEPLWIIFTRDMVITLKEELIMNSFKTLDGRGVDVHIAHGACISIQYISNVIIHGLHIHDCIPTGPAMARSTPTHYSWRTVADGDGISIFGSTNVWIDHCYLACCADGLVDAVMASTAITISSNYFTEHDKVMLLGHSDSYTADKAMQVTIAYNHFGEALIEIMPRHGYFEIVNNDYTEWKMYAIGGSANPTINSQGNRFLAPLNPIAKQVTMRIDANENNWKNWVWRSTGDMFLNGAYFTQSGSLLDSFQKSVSVGRKSSSMVGAITSNAGVLPRRRVTRC